MNDVFKALADPSRRHILRLLATGEKTAGQIAQRFALTKPSLSHHFNVLKDADLIVSRREGQHIHYALNTTVLQDLYVWLVDLVDP